MGRLEQEEMEGVFNDTIRGELEVEGHYMVGRVLPKLSFEFGNF